MNPYDIISQICAKLASQPQLHILFLNPDGAEALYRDLDRIPAKKRSQTTNEIFTNLEPAILAMAQAKADNEAEQSVSQDNDGHRES